MRSMKYAPKAFMLAAIAAAALLSACGEKAASPAAPQVAVPASAAQPAALPPASAPSVAAVASAQSPVVLPAEFTASAPGNAASASLLAATNEQLLTVAMWAGINSNLAAVPAESIAGSAEKWEALTNKVLDGKVPAELEKLTTAPWTKQIAYLQVDKRTVLFAALVEFQGELDARRSRRVMVVLTHRADAGNVLVASVDGIAGLGRQDRYVQSFPQFSQPIDLSGDEYARIRGNVAQLLRS